MSDPILEVKIVECSERLQELETQLTVAGYNLRTLRDTVNAERNRLHDLIRQMAGKGITLPGFDRGGSTNGKGTADEHQRGPTVFPQAASS
jgi:hypothetical protein